MQIDKSEFNKITYRNDLSNYEINRKGDMRNIKTGLLLKGSISRDGYLQYTVILNNGKKATIKAHRIVAGEYLGHVRGKRYVNHKDEDKTNCDIDNLEWVTAKENVNYLSCQKRRSEHRKQIVNEYDLDGRFIRTWKSAHDVVRYMKEELKLSTGNSDSIYSCCNGKFHIAFGRVWRYYDGDTRDIVLTSSELPMKKYWRKDWNSFVNAKDIPPEYLYDSHDISDIKEYFMSSCKLSTHEKMMLKELFSKIPQNKKGDKKWHI